MLRKNTFLKVVLMLMVAFSYQNCKIYDSEIVSEQEAISSGKQVKIYTPEMDDYVFKRLEMYDDEIVGVAKKKSKTAKRLVSEEELKANDSKYVKVPLSEIQIREIHEQNKTASSTLNIAISVVGFLTAFYFAFFVVN